MERLFSRMGKNKAMNFLILGRFWNATLPWLFSILGVKTASGKIPDVPSVLVLLIVISLIYMGCAGLNDVYDVRADRINMPYRPIQRKHRKS